jgi:modulator of FtsH protease
MVWYSAAPAADYVMVGGAAGALTGLLFVAVSINLERINGERGLPRRAAETLTIMVGLLILAVFMLAPQSRTALAIETLVLGVLR